MTKREAKRAVCLGAADILDNGSENEWLNGANEADGKKLQTAFEELCEELRRRGSDVKK